jgi:hypothetical protein
MTADGVPLMGIDNSNLTKLRIDGQDCIKISWKNVSKKASLRGRDGCLAKNHVGCENARDLLVNGNLGASGGTDPAAIRLA